MKHELEKLIAESVAITDPQIEVQEPPMLDAIASELRAHDNGVYRAFMIYKHDQNAYKYYDVETTQL